MEKTTAISKINSNEDHTQEVKTVFIPYNNEEIQKTGWGYYAIKLNEKLVEYKKYLESMISQLEDYFKSHGGVIAIDDNLFYFYKFNAVFPNPDKLRNKNHDDFMIKALKPYERKISGDNKCEVATKDELIAIIKSKKDINFGNNIEGFYYYRKNMKTNVNYYVGLNNPSSLHRDVFHHDIKENYTFLPIYRFDDAGKKPGITEVMRIFLEKNIKPAVLDGFDRCFEYDKYVLFSAEPPITINFEKVFTDFKNDVLLLEGRKWSQIKTGLKKDAKNGFESDCIDVAIKYFCNSDNLRANFPIYDKALLYEYTEGGHWDLYGAEFGEGVPVPVDKPFYARNPYMDIKKNSVIGIDFGTKSTIVALLDPKDKPYLLPVGGNYSSPKEKDTENPTVLHLCDFNSFMEQYRKKAGRPDTYYFNLTVSHTAAEELSNINDKNYYSFIASPKQWVAAENEKMVLFDDKDNKISVPPYLQCKDDDFDPIEIYAYYIGTVLNYMKQHEIYSKYLLSFPITFEKTVKDKLRESFKRGLIKSLPNVLANDKKFLESEFEIKNSTSEPAAYAVCALRSYGFKPKNENDVYYYGVFDFGGGTTDYDFGLWRGASEEEKEDNKSYVIDHFGGNGLKYLGGENLLEYLSFKVFSERQNQDKLREKKIWFTFPRCEQEKFPGYETVIKNDSRWANLNMHKMKEALRPVWERHENYEENYPENTIDCVLFNNDGVQQSDIRLNVDLEMLDREITEKVREGVKSFMTQMNNAMRNRNTRVKKIHIFLAGNSCKAAIVKNIFEEECEIYVKEYEKKLLDKGEELEDDLFIIYPPLGTDESDEIIKKQGLEVNKNDISRPTGKTGVAIGLILSRPGSPILVKNENVNLHGEKLFSFLVGRNLCEEFKFVLDFESKMNKWEKFKSANETTVEFYFTDDSNGRTGKLPIEKTKRLIRNLPEVKKNAFIFIRPVSPLEIEIKVSATEKSKPIWKIEKINLKEGK